MAAEVFGGSMTENFNPVMYGSVREVFIGLLRSLPDEDVTGLARVAQTARRLPRMARQTRPPLAASCEVAGMLAEQTGAPAAVSGPALLPDRPLGRPRPAAVAASTRRSRCRCGSSTWLPTPPSSATSAGVEHAVGIVRERAGHAFDPEVAACLVEGSAAILALRRRRLRMGRGLWPWSPRRR